MVHLGSRHGQCHCATSTLDDQREVNMPIISTIKLQTTQRARVCMRIVCVKFALYPQVAQARYMSSSVYVDLCIVTRLK